MSPYLLFALVGVFVTLGVASLSWWRHSRRDAFPGEARDALAARDARDDSAEDHHIAVSSGSDVIFAGDVIVAGGDVGPPGPITGHSQPDYDEQLRTAIHQVVQPGRLLFNPPSSMRLKSTERVEVRIARSEELGKELAANLRGSGLPRFETIETSVFMGVSLQGSGFSISPLSDTEQMVPVDDITTWEFDVQALERGPQTLLLRVSLKIPIGDDRERRSIPVFERHINVEVSFPALVGGFATRNWQWLIGTALALAGAAAAWAKFVP